MTDASHAQWADRIRKVGTEADGLMALLVVQRGDMPHLLAAALGGDVESMMTLKSVNEALHRIRNAPRKRQMLCGCCPRRLRNGLFAIVLARAATEDPEHGLALAICERCGNTVDEIEAAAVQALRRIWSDGRLIRVTHPNGGHA